MKKKQRERERGREGDRKRKGERESLFTAAAQSYSNKNREMINSAQEPESCINENFILVY